MELTSNSCRSLFHLTSTSPRDDCKLTSRSHPDGHCFASSSLQNHIGFTSSSLRLRVDLTPMSLQRRSRVARRYVMFNVAAHVLFASFCQSVSLKQDESALVFAARFSTKTEAEEHLKGRRQKATKTPKVQTQNGTHTFQILQVFTMQEVREHAYSHRGDEALSRVVLASTKTAAPA